MARSENYAKDIFINHMYVYLYFIIDLVAQNFCVADAAIKQREIVHTK